MMAWITTITCLLAFYVNFSYQISTPEDPEYVAAAVEYTPKLHPGNGPLTIQDNALAYIEYIKQARQAGVDIIVFPEDTLTTTFLPPKPQMESWTTYVPSPSDNYVPCDQDTITVNSAFKLLSCAAKEHQMYLVINIAEKFDKCTDLKCTQTELVYYNSNVVFDRTGKVIARYRKVNLFEEMQFDVTEQPEVVTFDTDFGVKFGTFICFDILFYVPALNLTRDHGVTDIVYSAAWFSEVPFLTSVQTQFGWAYSQNVNLIAAGYNTPIEGSTGSGIYLGRKGIAQAAFSLQDGNKLLIARVPKIGRSAVVNEKKSRRISVAGATTEGKVSPLANTQVFLHNDNITAFNSLPVDGPLDTELCQGDFCCTFKLDASNFDPTTKYRIVIFNGWRYYGSQTRGYAQACGLVQCSHDTLISCGATEDSRTIFNRIEISATYSEYRTNLVIPSILNSTLLPFENFDYDEHQHDDHVHVTMTLNTPTNNIATFGLYGRLISEDAKNSDSSIIASLSIIWCLALALLWR